MRAIQGLTFSLAVALLALLSSDEALQAQSIMTATVVGSVQDALGQPIAGALVTLTSLDGGGSREVSASGDGSFRFGLVAPGSYEARAEALGYRPVVARVLTLGGGETTSIDLQIAQAPPPVLDVDTVAVGASGSSRFTDGGVRFDGRDLDELPYRRESLNDIVSRSSSFDLAAGSQGLPGYMTVEFVDGLPVYRSRNPLSTSERVTHSAFPRSFLAGAAALHTPSDVELEGSAGGVATVATRAGSQSSGWSLEAAGSGTPLWSSGEVGGSTPALVSFQGAGLTTIPVDPGASQIVVAGDVFRQDTPLPVRLTEDAAVDLTGLDAELITDLTEPTVSRLSRYSGLVRFDAQDPGRYLFVRGAAGYTERSFEGAGPLLARRGLAPDEESIEYSFAGGYVSEIRPSLSIELRAGISGGDRTFERPEGAPPAAFLAESGHSLGAPPEGDAMSSRTDLVLNPVLRQAVGQGSLKFGLDLRLATHSMRQSLPSEYVFSDAAALTAGDGFARSTSPPEASFSTQEIGGFLQFDTELAPGLDGSFGARLDYERIPGDDVTLNDAWLQASGLSNEDHPRGVAQLGGHAALEWRPAPDTRLVASGVVRFGDVDSRAIAELFSRDVNADQTTFVGSGLSWPDGALPAGASTLPSVTLLGQDSRPPRTMQLNAGLIRGLFEGWSLHLGASLRRTDFLLRRRNLNLPVVAQAEDPNGRSIFGSLQQNGATVTATGGDARRFSAFGPAWALDSSGWSEYMGATAGLEYAGSGLDLFVSYTRSKTEDNWIGASSGSFEAQLPPSLPMAGWATGTSDFDVPHRVSAAAMATFGRLSLSGIYQFRSGHPITPGYRYGVDANGDGAFLNDVAYVDAAMVDGLLSDWPCLEDQLDGFAVRNSCRGPSVHSVDVRLEVQVAVIGGRTTRLFVDGFNLVESSDGVIDDALLLVDPSGSINTSPDGSVVTIPFMANPDFGQTLYPTSSGRLVRVGLRIG